MQLSFVTKVVGELEKEVRGGGGEPEAGEGGDPPPYAPHLRKSQNTLAIFQCSGFTERPKLLTVFSLFLEHVCC
jgi:hypothetical protein